jgi:thymidylate kinase
MIFKFFKFLQKNDINFCLINGYQEVISNKNSDSDIDILISKKNFAFIERLVSDFCIQEHYQVVQVLHHELGAKNIFLFDTFTSKFLNLDLYSHLSREGVRFFDEGDIFDTIDNYEGIPILSAEKELIYYLVKKLSKKDLSEENFYHLCKLFNQDHILSEHVISHYLPIMNIRVITAFKNNDFFGLIEINDLILSDLCKLKKVCYKAKLFNSLRVIKRLLKPTGFSIAFLGPDGSGKSTIINALSDTRLPYRRKDYFHLKPLVVKNSSDELDITDPHKYPPYSAIKSYLKLILFVYQYNKGWLQNILQLKIRSSLVIFDRYFDDLLIDSRRYRYGGVFGIAKFARCFIPKPDIYFILTTEASVIYQRKQEVTFDELNRQLTAYNAIADGKRYFRIDVKRSPEAITNEILQLMMSKMNERY